MLGKKAPNPDGKSVTTYRELLVRKVLAMALSGNLKAAEIILDRDDPKSLNLRHEEIIQVQIAMEVALPPQDWEPRTLIAKDNERRLLPGGGNGR